MSATARKQSRLRQLSDEYRGLAARLREGGGAERVARMHQQAAERGHRRR